MILVGEVRDLETARIAMQASLTGHLVFATLHTNDAVGAFTRLADMEIPPYLIASSLVAVLTQRLVRVLCPVCKTAAGRTGIFEMVTVTPSLRQRITSRASEAELCAAARAAGSTSLFEDGLRKVLAGTVGYDELLRVAEPPAPLEG